MKYEIKTTLTFDKWLKAQRDRQAVRAIALRIARAELGNFGDSEPVGEGVSEMRIFIGKGYRVYYALLGKAVVLLLNGGIKSNKKQQQTDIEIFARVGREEKMRQNLADCGGKRR